jgi:predicted AAA+ superfamily ATPase
MATKSEKDQMARIAAALERLAPPRARPADLKRADAFVWHAAAGSLEPVAKVNRIDIGLLKGIDLTRDILLENTARFAKGLPANNALLWARAAWASRRWSRPSITRSTAKSAKLWLVEIHRGYRDPPLMALIRQGAHVPASSCSATISPSMPRIRPTSR